MPIGVEVDRKQKLFYTTCIGTITIEDFMLHQREAGSDSSIYGYNELFDTTNADLSSLNHQALLSIAQNTLKLPAVDPNSRVAILVNDAAVEVLGDLYKAIEDVLPEQSRELKIFYNRDEALQWLKQSS